MSTILRRCQLTPINSNGFPILSTVFSPTPNACFSTTSCYHRRIGGGRVSKATKQRKAMFAFLQNSERLKYIDSTEPGQARPTSKTFSRGGSTQYVTGNPKYPFPMNRLFVSEPVLDDSSKELIYRKIKFDGLSVKAVSAMYGVDIRRVVAVVRLKYIEKLWALEGKTFANKYADAILGMLPQFNVESSQAPFESINDVPVHPSTVKQLFVPVPESKQFNRSDAARAFHRHLLPTDKRIPIPELIKLEKDRIDGISIQQSATRFADDTLTMERAFQRKLRDSAAQQAQRVTKVDTQRFEFRFQSFEAEDSGKNGRSRDGVGWRYGVHLYDRQKGHTREVPKRIGLYAE